jgi:hypothetical protein
MDVLDRPRGQVGSLAEVAEHAALTAMLLHLARGLQRVHMCLPPDNAYNTILAELTSLYPPLLSLKALAFRSLDTIFRPTGLSGAAPILRLAPNLRALHLGMSNLCSFYSSFPLGPT